jgi:hypothetical protein
MKNKRTELANILRLLADYIDRCPDPELAPIFEQAAALMQLADSQKKTHTQYLGKFGADDLREIVVKLRDLPSRDAGVAFLHVQAPTRRALEVLARFLQLPVQRDDTVERLRTKIVESTVGSRLRSDAIQGKESQI